jgi:hypothetical protein
MLKQGPVGSKMATQSTVTTNNCDSDTPQFSTTGNNMIKLWQNQEQDFGIPVDNEAVLAYFRNVALTCNARHLTQAPL